MRVWCLAIATFVFALSCAATAAAQTEGTTTTTTTTPLPPGAPVGETLIPPNTATIAPNGTAVPPANAPLAVRNAIRAANRIHTKTYIWGGGHRRWKAKGYDCSGAVSFVLHAAGLLSFPLVSGQLAKSWGTWGSGSWITVYANRSHTYAVIAGLRWDTSPVGEAINQGRGPRWRYTIRTGNGFAVRHYPGL
jgi:hypothetical protein